MIRSGGNRPDSRFSNLSAFFCLCYFVCALEKESNNLTVLGLSTLPYSICLFACHCHPTRTVCLDLSACLTVRGTNYYHQTSIRGPTAAGSPLFLGRTKAKKSQKEKRRRSFFFYTEDITQDPSIYRPATEIRTYTPDYYRLLLEIRPGDKDCLF